MSSRVHRLPIVVAVLVSFGVWGGVALSAPANPGAKPKPQPASPATLYFDETCTAGRRAVVAAVGDLLFHDALQVQAYKSGANFRQFWAPVASVLAQADITYGNLESPIAEGVKPGGVATKDPGRRLDRVVYGRKSDALIFNTHPSLAADLRASGFSIISTANNHAADRGALGIDRTLDALAKAGLAATGTRHRASSAPWHTRTSANGLTVAWLACTFDLNGMPDRHNQVLQCYRDKDIVLDEIRALAVDPFVDAIIVTPHWGEENTQRPLPREKLLARELIDAGATAILGAHPHVLQPWEKVIARDGREALVVYSLGNFISNQPGDAQRSGLIALLELTKPDGERARLSGAGFVPTFVAMDKTASRGHRVGELAAGRSAFDQVTRLLPAGNRVTASAFRDLPRDCKSMPPAVVATNASSPAISDPIEPDRDSFVASSVSPTTISAIANADPPRPSPAPNAHRQAAASSHMWEIRLASRYLIADKAISGGHREPAECCTCFGPLAACPHARSVAFGDRRSLGTVREAEREAGRARRRQRRLRSGDPLDQSAE